MATEIVKDTELHQFHRTLVLNNKPSWSNTNKKFHLFKNTRSNTIRLHHTNISNFTNKQIIWNTQLHKNKTLHNGLALFKTMTNLTTHPADKPQHIRNNLEFFFLPHTWYTAYHHQPSSPERFSLFQKKKTHQREREWGRRVHHHEAPTPAGSIKNQLPPKKKEGERAETRQLRIEE